MKPDNDSRLADELKGHYDYVIGHYDRVNGHYGVVNGHFGHVNGHYAVVNGYYGHVNGHYGHVNAHYAVVNDHYGHVNGHYAAVNALPQIYFTAITIFVAMKVLAVLMTILILFTGFDLCEDQNSPDKEERVEACETDDDSHQEEEPCTPFCHCARCPFSVVLPSVSKERLISFLRIEKYDVYVPPVPIQFSPSIWQPPKYS